MVARKGLAGGWGGVVWVKLLKRIKRYKLSVIREISLGDVTYSMVTIVNNMGFECFCRRVNPKSLIPRKKL